MATNYDLTPSTGADFQGRHNQVRTGMRGGYRPGTRGDDPHNITSGYGPKSGYSSRWDYQDVRYLYAHDGHGNPGGIEMPNPSGHGSAGSADDIDRAPTENLNDFYASEMREDGSDVMRTGQS
jgi:hypothetical protein